MSGKQLVFEFAESIEKDVKSQDEVMEEVASQAKDEFEEFMDKYKVSPNDRAYIHILACHF